MRALAIALAIVIPLSVTLTTIISNLLGFLCLFFTDRNKLKRALKHPVSIAIFVLLALYLLGTLYSVANSKSIILALRKIARLLFIPLLIPLFYEKIWRRRTLVAYLLAVTFSIVVAAIHTKINYGNTTPVFKDSIFTSLFAAFSIFCFAHLSIEYKKYRWLCIMAAVFLSYYLFFMNYGRTGQLLIFMLFCLFCWQQFKSNFKYLIMSGLLLLVVVGGITLLPSSFAVRGEIAKNELQHFIERDHVVMPHTSSVGLRLLMAHNSLELIKQKPLFGWGTGSFKAAYSRFVPYENIDKQEDRANPHNQYLLVAVELGIVGLLALLYFFVSLAREFLKSDSLDAKLGFGLLCTIAIGCLVNSWLLDFASMYFFVLLAAVFIAGTEARKA